MTATVANHHVSLPRHGDQSIARRVKLLVSNKLLVSKELRRRQRQGLRQRPVRLDPFFLQPSAL